MTALRILPAAGLGLAALAACLLFLPAGPRGEVFVDIPSGTSTPRMAALLQRDGIVRSRFAFDLLHLLRPRTLKAGEYRFDGRATVLEVYRRIARGDVYTRAVPVPEGFNMFDIAAAVEQAGLGSASDFLAAARRDTGLVRDLDPRATSLEGYLFPDTYRFSRHASADQIVASMVQRFRQKTASLSIRPETVTLASIVEREVRDPAERFLVAGVFRNRLARGMPLATDPTVIYAALLDGRGVSPKTVIYRSDLDALSSYNTYRHPGLPPGPICNPGLASLSAALHPAPTDFLYFVADGAGHSRFSATLDGHHRNVLSYHEALAAPKSSP